MVPTMFSRLLKLPERGARRGRPVVARGHHPRRRAVPGAGEGADDRVVSARSSSSTTAPPRPTGSRAATSSEWLAHPGTVGQVASSASCCILDDDGNECPPARTGTVWFEGATNFEYYNDPEKTAESRDHERQRSTVGDVGYVDDDGFLYLTDRKTYMIISGGVNIYPQETENLLITHPKVIDAAVIGVPERGPRRGGQGRRPARRRRRAGPERRTGAHRVLRRAPGPLQVPRSSTSRTSSPACPPASSTSGCSGTATGPATTTTRVRTRGRDS